MNNDFSKQSRAEEHYRRLRNQQPNEYTGDFNSSHITDVLNPADISPRLTQRENFTTDYRTDFDKASRDFWQRETQTGLAKYSSGNLTANFGREEYTFEEFMARISKFIKESISNELLENGHRPEDLKDHFESVNIAIKLLAKEVDKISESKRSIKLENVIAFLHGFINTYVAKNLHKKVEREKGNLTL